MANTNNQQDMVTGEVRLSYVHLFQPYANQAGQEPKFSTTLLIPKTDVATKQRIDAAINAAIQAGVSDKFGGVRPPILGAPIHDGDGQRPSDGMPFGAECKGHWVLTASSKKQVEVVDINVNPILNQTEVYSGMYARVGIRFYAYNTNGKKGIGCGLGPVQKLRDGEPLGGGVSAAAAFGDMMPQSAAPAYQQPVYQQPQAPAQNYAQPGYPPQQVAPAYPPAAIDPITGRPVAGGVMGL